MAKDRTTVFLGQDDRDAVRAIKLSRRLDSDGAAIRYAIRVIADQERASVERATLCATEEGASA